MLGILLRTRLAAFIGSLGNGKDGKFSTGRIIGLSLLFGFLILFFGFYIVMIAASLAMVLVPAGLDAAYFAIFNILTFALVFVFSVFETKSQLFECRDNELLLSMPIPEGSIVLSRVLSIVILNAIEALFVMIPVTVMYTVFGGSPLYIPSALIAALLISLVATALASAVGYLVAVISKRFKNNTFIPVIASLAFLAAYFVFMFGFVGTAPDIEENPEDFLAALAAALSPISFLGEISILSPLPTVIFVLFSLGISALAYYIISKSYIRIITDTGKEKKKEYVREELKSGTALLALLKKDISAFLSSSTYILNGGIGAILQVGLSVMLLINREDISSIFAELSLLIGDISFPVVLASLLVGLSGTISISASALSFEGKYYWLIKTSPIPPTTLIMAKLAPHLIIALPSSLISSVLVAIATSADPLTTLYIILLPLLATVNFAMLGLLLNIAFPKFNFSSDAEVVKQSLPVFIVTFGAMFFVIALLFLTVFLSMLLGTLAAALIISAATLLVFLTEYLILTGPAAKRIAAI